MASRNSELPEGTDTIINGAMETETSVPSSGGGGSSSGFIGGAAGDGSALATTSGGTGTDDTGGLRDKLRSEASSLRGQAGSRVRDFAESGKSRATDALDEVARVVEETAATLDERLGEEYGGYARRASGAVSDFAETLRSKDVEELYDGARDAVRKSPGIAIAAAAIVGFALVRMVKAGLPDRSFEGGESGGKKRGSRGGGA
jgi:hypothetical protein